MDGPLSYRSQNSSDAPDKIRERNASQTPKFDKRSVISGKHKINFNPRRNVVKYVNQIIRIDFTLGEQKYNPCKSKSGREIRIRQ